MQRSRIPESWHEEHAEKQVKGQTVLDGFISGGDLSGTYTQSEDVIVLTMFPSSAAWALRIVSQEPLPLPACIEALVAAAEKAGFVER